MITTSTSATIEADQHERTIAIVECLHICVCVCVCVCVDSVAVAVMGIVFFIFVHRISFPLTHSLTFKHTICNGDNHSNNSSSRGRREMMQQLQLFDCICWGCTSVVVVVVVVVCEGNEMISSQSQAQQQQQQQQRIRSHMYWKCHIRC